ncbi:hypothetical protein E4U45_005393 [Claviceps purpurea]|nr:hypothetical protein E4U45_005393 [Claviceps purpurea]
MEVLKFSEFFVEKDGEDEFGFTKIIIRGPNREFYYAISQDRFFKSSEIDLDNLNKIPIDMNNVWPRYSARFLRAPSPVPQGSYVKETNLGSHEECPDGMEEMPLSDLVLHEIEAYELLRPVFSKGLSRDVPSTPRDVPPGFCRKKSRDKTAKVPGQKTQSPGIKEQRSQHNLMREKSL